MKKVCLILSIIFFVYSPVFAECDYTKYCTQQPYNLSSGGSQLFSNLTGMTFLAEKITEAIINKELKKSTKQKFRTKVSSYSIQDLIKGKFQSFEISGKNLNLDDVYITSLKLNTLCSFNNIGLEKNLVIFKENMVMGFNIEISEEDLEKTINSAKYLKKVRELKLSNYGITFFKLSDIDVEISDGKMYFVLEMTSPLASKTLLITVNTDLQVTDGRIYVTDLTLENKFANLSMKKIAHILNSLNPVSFSLNILENKDSKIYVNNVALVNNKVIINGVIFIPRNVKTKTERIFK